jgi:hypothetical protein
MGSFSSRDGLPTVTCDSGAAGRSPRTAVGVRFSTTFLFPGRPCSDFELLEYRCDPVSALNRLGPKVRKEDIHANYERPQRED